MRENATDPAHSAPARAPAPAPAPAAAAAAAGGIAERMLALQRGVGNRAVARAVLAREEWTPGAPVSLAFPPRAPVGTGINPGFGLIAPPVLAPPPPIPFAVSSRITAYLETRKLAIGMKVDEGAISLPEVVAAVRADVPESLQIEVWQIQQIVRDVMGRQTPPDTRGKRSAGSVTAEITAAISNSLPKPPTSITLGTKAGSLELSIGGIEAKTTIGGAKLKLRATPRRDRSRSRRAR